MSSYSVSPMPNAPLADGPPSPSRILVCDDDAVAARETVAALQAAGFVCDVAATPAQAWASLQSTRFDVVTADLVTTAGFEFVRALSEAPEAPPVIVITATPSVAAAQQALRLRVIDYLAKPIDDALLVDGVRKGVAAHGVARMLRARRSRLEAALHELKQCEATVRQPHAGVAPGSLELYLELTVQQAVATVSELADVARAVLANGSAGSAADRLQDARPLQLIDAVRETILVLEHTKSSFRSRELADLRKKLEALVSAVRSGDAAG